MGTNMEQPPLATEEGSFDPDWELDAKADGLWLQFPERGESINLGDEEQALQKMAEFMAERHFDEP